MPWLFQRNKCFRLVLLGPNEEVVKFKNFNVWYLIIEGLLHSASKKSQKVLVTVVCFCFCLFIYLFIYFAVLSLVFELKHNLEAQQYPKKNS